MLLESLKFEPLDHCSCNSASKIFRIYNTQTRENVNLVMKTSQHSQDSTFVSPFYSPSSSHQPQQLQNQQIQESQVPHSGLKNNKKSRAKQANQKALDHQKAQAKIANDMISSDDESHCNFHCYMIHKEWQLLENILPHPNIVQVYKVFENVDCFYSQSSANEKQKAPDMIESSLNSQTQEINQQNVLSPQQNQHSDSCCALLMEEAEMDLFDYVEKHYNLNRSKHITNLIDMYRQVAQGLDHIHSFNYSHNDIKSENVLVFSHLKEAKITDFGLANDLNDYKDLNRPQIIQKQVQQWEYRCLNHAAPEILNTLKTRSCDFDEQKADVFAFGVSFFESVFGFRPFVQYALPSDPIYKHFANKQSFSRFWKTNTQIQAVLREINNGDVDIEKLFDIIYKTLNKNPKQRISSADLLIDPLFD